MQGVSKARVKEMAMVRQSGGGGVMFRVGRRSATPDAVADVDVVDTPEHAFIEHVCWLRRIVAVLQAG